MTYKVYCESNRTINYEVCDAQSSYCSLTSVQSYTTTEELLRHTTDKQLSSPGQLAHLTTTEALTTTSTPVSMVVQTDIQTALPTTAYSREKVFYCMDIQLSYCMFFFGKLNYHTTISII